MISESALKQIAEVFPHESNSLSPSKGILPGNFDLGVLHSGQLTMSKLGLCKNDTSMNLRKIAERL